MANARCIGPKHKWRTWVWSAQDGFVYDKLLECHVGILLNIPPYHLIRWTLLVQIHK